MTDKQGSKILPQTMTLNLWVRNNMASKNCKNDEHDKLQVHCNQKIKVKALDSVMPDRSYFDACN